MGELVERVRIGVIGYGYWGPNLVRNFSDCPDTRVVAVSDLDSSRLEIAERRHPNIRVTLEHDELFSSHDIDAIAIATPVATHYDLALRAMKAGKHVFVEKPLAESTEQAASLVEEAFERELVLHGDHTFLYTGAVRKMKELVDHGDLGPLDYYVSMRVNLGAFQPDVNVIWDLAVHDLAILHYLHPVDPVAVSATGSSHVPGKPANLAFLTLLYDNSMIANIHVSWLAPVKVRRVLVGGALKMIVYDELDEGEKVKVYDKGVMVADTKEKLYETVVSYRTGDMWAPKLDSTEALKVEADAFARAVQRGELSPSSGKEGLWVVKILEAATSSMKDMGRPVYLNRVAGKT